VGGDAGSQLESQLDAYPVWEIEVYYPSGPQSWWIQAETPLSALMQFYKSSLHTSEVDFSKGLKVRLARQ